MIAEVSVGTSTSSSPLARSSRSSNPLVLALALASIAVGAVAVHGALRWYGAPMAGILVTLDGSVASVGAPDWDGIRQGLRFPDRVVAADGRDLEAPRGAAWDRAVAAAARAGRTSVHARVESRAGTREVDLAVTPLGAPAWWLSAGGLLFVAGLYVVAALTALAARPGGALARAFAKFALLAALFLATFFDCDTTRALVPLFDLALAWGPFALVALALRLPDDVAIVRRFRALPAVLDGAGVTLGAATALTQALGRDGTPLVSVCTVLLGAAILSFVAVFAVRYLRAQGARRELMQALARATLVPYALIGVGVLATMQSARGSSAAFFAMPALALAPVASGVAFVRHDLWGSRALLSRLATRTLVAAVTCALAAGVAAAFVASLGVPFGYALGAAAAGALAAAPLVHFSLRALDRRVFGSAMSYKPTIEQLSEDLTSIHSMPEVASAIERTVRRWLDCERVHFSATGSTPPPRPDASSEDRTLPATFGGRTLGHLHVGAKRGGALFTTDDLDLLRTIANQAALALAHAQSYAELEDRRRAQAAAWQTERSALVETVAAEVGHEVRYSINFFRSIFKRGSTSSHLDAEAIDIGCEEVDRLERLVSELRRARPPRRERQTFRVADLAARTEVLLRDALGSRGLDVEVPERTSVRCDSDQATQILVNLVSNAIDACGAAGKLGVEWRATGAGADLVVWDTGPGFEGEASQLFTPWFTTKPRGTGLGLAIAQRLVRAHGWNIDAARAEGVTRFVVSIPASDVIEGSRA